MVLQEAAAAQSTLKLSMQGKVAWLDFRRDVSCGFHCL